MTLYRMLLLQMHRWDLLADYIWRLWTGLVWDLSYKVYQYGPAQEWDYYQEELASMVQASNEHEGLAQMVAIRERTM